jgi:deoxyribodipyrimidine photolyase
MGTENASHFIVAIRGSTGIHFSELEQAATHDPYLNAAMQEVKTTGIMQGSMRMYRGKIGLRMEQHTG